MRVTQIARLKKLLLVFAMGMVVLYLSACSIRPVSVNAPTDKQLQLVLTVPEIVSADQLAMPEADLLGLTPAMKDLVANYITADMRPEQRLQKLFELLRYNPEYAVEYSASATYTAAEVYRYQRANCLSFSAMFIALAREAGLDARFQEVDLPPEWDALRDDTLVQYRHVNVRVSWGRNNEGIVDFRMDRYSHSFPRRVISDSYGQAQYYSNISMQSLIKGQLADAYLAVYRAINADPSQSYIWSNMGIVQRRLGNLAAAEVAYRQALTLDPRDISAANNLAILYELQGRNALAEEIRRYSEANKLNNPYYRYALAQNAYLRGNYDEALAQISVAMRKQSHEHRFYFLRGLSLWHKGESQSAINNVKRAIRMATEADPVEEYQAQLAEWLASRG